MLPPCLLRLEQSRVDTENVCPDNTDRASAGNKGLTLTSLEPAGDNNPSLGNSGAVRSLEMDCVDTWHYLSPPRRQICQRRQPGCQDPEPPHEEITDQSLSVNILTELG